MILRDRKTNNLARAILMLVSGGGCLLSMIMFATPVFAIEEVDGVSNDFVQKLEQTITTPQNRYGVAPSHKPFNINAKAKTHLKYESSNPLVASVSAEGVVKPKKAGDAYITITAKETAEYKEASKKVHIDINKYKSANGYMMSASKNIDGKSGDSSGDEARCCKYIYNKKVNCYNWNFIIRCTDPEISNRAAAAVYYIVKNDNFGYNAHKPTSQKVVNRRRSVYDAVHKVVGDNPSYEELKKIRSIKTKANTSCSPMLLAGYWLYYDLSPKIHINWRKPYHKKKFYYNCGSVNIEQNGLRRAIRLINKQYINAGKLAPFEIIEVSKKEQDKYFGKGSNMKKKLKRGDIVGSLHDFSKSGHSIMIR